MAKNKRKIGFIGKGNVGGALSRGLKRAGHDVRTAGKGADGVRDVAAWADVVVMAVPFSALGDAVKTAGEALDGKVIVDATNAIDANMALAVGFTTSGAEELQKKAPKAKVVKAFNTVFAKHMETGKIGQQAVSALVAGDDAAAKTTVLELARDIGFDAVDSGPLKNARLIEPLAMLNIQLGYGLKNGTETGFRYLHG